MTRKAVQSQNAPKATGPFSQAILHNYGYVMELSGQVGINPESGKLVEGGVGPETEQVLANIKAILREVGWSFNNIVKARIFLTDMKDYQIVNEIYGKSFASEPPARVTVAVKQLPLGALVEIECAAAGKLNDKNSTPSNSQH
ncbi:reactive intermediate/imine deaminase [Candidatus Woesearchaeota archaeon]|nr:reactive intermediate/imine deaminase [Candidatus Woesearchaeota archaeon]